MPLGRSPVLLLSLAAGACHEGSSLPVGGPDATATNLGLAAGSSIGLDFGTSLGSGSLRLIVVSEEAQGMDLDGDGDRLDGVVHILDLERDTVVNTGLVLGITEPHGSEALPRPVADVGATVAFGVDELETGGLDRNGDGDAEDFVLALYDRWSASLTSLALATDHVVVSEHVLAFDVQESAQGQDLDGDGSASSIMPFVHDLRSGETWNTGLRGTRVLSAQGPGVLTVESSFVALAASEFVLGDLNGDGDAQDSVLEVYDASARTVQHTGLALSQAIGGIIQPIPHRGRWAFMLVERNQGADLDGDGDMLDAVAVVYDPRSQTARTLGKLDVITAVPDGGPLVLVEPYEPGGPPDRNVWLYDPDRDLLENTGFRTVNVLAVGARLALLVLEESQGVDFDRNGFLDSHVPVLHDLASGRSEDLGIDTTWLWSRGGRFLLRAREERSRRDWNGDGDREDGVLFTGEERNGRLVNTRLATRQLAWLSDEIALLELSETDRGVDLNGDGDAVDEVLHSYDVKTGRLANLRVAAGYLLGGADDRVLLTVDEEEQGQDLNGDGDQADYVLHVAEAMR